VLLSVAQRPEGWGWLQGPTGERLEAWIGVATIVVVVVLAITGLLAL